MTMLYRNNVASCPKWQEQMCKVQSRLHVLWGKYKPSFDFSEPEACRLDVPGEEVHVLDAGHFALDITDDEIKELLLGFL